MPSLIKVKDESIRFKDLQPQTLLAITFAKELYDQTFSEQTLANYPFVITSCNDGRHMNNSLHYNGCAFDMRIWAFETCTDKRKELLLFKEKLAKYLGPDFDVVLEKDHFHIEYDPR